MALVKRVPDYHDTVFLEQLIIIHLLKKFHYETWMFINISTKD